jgi:RNA polymerase sigma factor (sigma-70 family)
MDKRAFSKSPFAFNLSPNLFNNLLIHYLWVLINSKDTMSFRTQLELYQALISPDVRQESIAFDYLYQQLYGSFRQWVFQHSGTDQDAEDAFQKGLLIFVVNIREGKYQLQDNTKVTTVVFDYCKKIWLNELNSSRLKTRGAMPESYEPTEIADTPQDDLERTETVNTVKKALSQLKDDCRNMITWFYIEELSLKEIAIALNMKEDSTKQKRFDCMKKLRGIFTQIAHNL